MRWRRLTAGLALLCAALLAVALVSYTPAHNPIVNATPVGMVINCPVVDESAGRAFVLDNGVIDQQVTVQGNGYGWSGDVSTNTLRIVDTRTGKPLPASAAVGQALGSISANLYADAYTHRLFAFDQQAAQVQVIDTRDGRLLGSTPYEAGFNVDTALADARSGHLFVVAEMDGSNGSPENRIWMLDGNNGKTLRDISVPYGRVNAAQGVSGYVSPTFSAALDRRAGRLYVFAPDRRMSVLDTTSGRLLFTHRLDVALAGAVVDGRTGRVFAFDVSPHQAAGVAVPRYAFPPSVNVLMLDAHSGTILRSVLAGVTPSGAAGIAVDEETSRVFVLDWRRDTVSVLDAASGRRLRTIRYTGPYGQLVLDTRHHHALILGGTGHDLIVLDTRDGAPLRTLTLPRQVQLGCMALDSGSGHLIATSSELLAGPPDRWSWLPLWLRARLPWIPPAPPSLGPSQRLVHNMLLTLDTLH